MRNPTATVRNATTAGVWTPLSSRVPNIALPTSPLRYSTAERSATSASGSRSRNAGRTSRPPSTSKLRPWRKRHEFLLKCKKLFRPHRQRSPLQYQQKKERSDRHKDIRNQNRQLSRQETSKMSNICRKRKKRRGISGKVSLTLS